MTPIAPSGALLEPCQPILQGRLALTTWASALPRWRSATGGSEPAHAQARGPIQKGRASSAPPPPTDYREALWGYLAREAARVTCPQASRRAFCHATTAWRHRPGGLTRSGVRSLSCPSAQECRLTRSVCSGAGVFAPINESPAFTGLSDGGRYWARTSDPQLVELVPRPGRATARARKRAQPCGFPGSTAVRGGLVAGASFRAFGPLVAHEGVAIPGNSRP
jgi:hypothetical protein